MLQPNQKRLWKVHEKYHGGSVFIPTDELIGSIRMFRYIEDREAGFRKVADALARYGNSIVFYIYGTYLGYRHGTKSEDYVCLSFNDLDSFVLDPEFCTVKPIIR